MQSKHVIKHVFSNGLTLLIKPTHLIPKVSVQLWYNVGSKDEQTSERGIAHLIEHMIFKGTKILSESDINLITHKLSGQTNAFTSYDYTGYLFDFPSQQWEESLTILADCMKNCLFKEEHLRSEMKAVIQELKMYKDNYISSILESLVSAMFGDHPYHHPIIGYKHDLWSLKNESLHRFYKHHYIPNNATLVIVGDVDPKEVVELVEENFGSLEPNFSYKKEKFHHGLDLRAQSVTLLRDVQVPMVVLGWVIPGMSTKNSYLVALVSWFIGSGKGSRLYKKLVDDLQLVTDLEVFSYDLFEYGTFFIYFQPKKVEDIEKIAALIDEEFQHIISSKIPEQELTRAIKQVEVEHLSLLEHNQKVAYEIGKSYLATGDAEYVFTHDQREREELEQEIKDFIASYLRKSLIHVGKVLPLPEEEKIHWEKMQLISDKEDTAVLSQVTRKTEVEGGSRVAEIEVKPSKPFHFPRAEISYLENGLKILSHKNAQLPKIDIIVEFEAKHTYDPEGKCGLGNFVAAMLLEGTKNYTAQEFATTVESYGMSIDTAAGQITISLLAEDLPKALELLNEMLIYATFPEKSIEKVREQMLADLQEYWDTPMKFATQLAREEIYKGLPRSKNALGKIDDVKHISREDLVEYYDKYISPQGTRICIVGDIERYDSKALFNHMLGSWEGPTVLPLEIKPVEPIEFRNINYPILRDQTVLCYAGISVSRTDKDFDKFLLFDQIFTGGVLGSMASRLFDLREESGLFYTIGGSLLAGSSEQKGLILVKTIVSNDRLKEAEAAIENLIDTAALKVSDDEFNEAKQAIANSLVDNFATNFQIAATLLYKDRFDFPEDYYDTRALKLAEVTKEAMQEAVKSRMNTKHFIRIEVGRI